MTDAATEWLETDGLGAYASGTTSGVRTRRYHALLMTATTPPTGRLVLVNAVEAWIDASRVRPTSRSDSNPASLRSSVRVERDKGRLRLTADMGRR